MDYVWDLAVKASIFAILASSLNMSVGYTGLLTLAHSGFMGVGAYTFAILTTQSTNPPPGAEMFNLPLWPALIVAGLVAGIAALLVSPILRLKGHFFVLSTVTVQLTIIQVLLSWQWMTNGSLAIRDVPRLSLFGFTPSNPQEFLLVSIPVAAIVILVIRQLVSSPYGRVLTTIRANPQVAESIGKNVGLYRLRVFMLTAFMAGIGGAVFASYVTVAAHTQYLVEFSTFLLMMVILGGTGRWMGALIGVVAYIVIGESVRFIPGIPPEMVGGFRAMIFSGILFLAVLYRPQGLIGRYRLE